MESWTKNHEIIPRDSLMASQITEGKISQLCSYKELNYDIQKQCLYESQTHQVWFLSTCGEKKQERLSLMTMK